MSYPGSRRWSSTTMLARCLLQLCALGCGAARPATPNQASSSPPPPATLVCSDSTRALEGFWSATSKQETRQAIVAVPGLGGEATAELVLAGLDTAARDWAAANTKNCSDVPREPAARLPRARIGRCLNDALGAQAALVEALKAPDVEILINVQKALAVVAEKTRACSREPVHAFFAAGETARDVAAAEAAARELSRAEVLFHLKKEATAEAAYQRALPFVSRAGDARLEVLTTIAEGTKLNGEHNHAEALKRADQALKRARAAGLLAGEAEALALTALILKERGDVLGSLEWFEKALPLYERVFGDGSLKVSSIRFEIANAYLDSEQFDAALEWFGKTLTARQRLFGDRHPVTLDVENGIGTAQCGKAAFADALGSFRAALARSQAVAINAQSTATLHTGAGHVLREQGNLEEALAAHDKALKLYQTTLGEDREGAAVVTSAIAMVHQDQGKYDEALRGFQKALAYFEGVSGKPHFRVGALSTNIGGLYKQRAEYRTALEWHQRALAIFKSTRGENHTATGMAHNNIGLVQHELGDYGEALRSFDKAIKIKERMLGRRHPSTSNSYTNIGLTYASLKQPERALEWYKKALAIDEQVFGKEHAETAGTYNNIGNAEARRGNHSEALVWYEKALAIKERTLGKDHGSTANTYANIGASHSALENYDAALESYGKALAIKERVHGKNHPSTASTYHNLGTLEARRRRYDEALKWYKIAFEIQERILGSSHPDTQMTRRNIERAEDLKRINRN